MDYKKLIKCLVCGNSLFKTLDLGFQPLINNLKDNRNKNEEKYPLLLNSCLFCSHQQLSIAVNPELLFSNYLYQTGTSESHIRFFKDFVKSIKYSGNSVLDIGCNDGSLMYEFIKLGWLATGIEPTEFYQNQFRKVIKDFFPTKDPINEKFDVITAFNVFAHNDNPEEFLLEAKKLLNDNGRIYIQTVPIILGNIYHEHISYFNPLSMAMLCRIVGLELISLKIVSMHGGSHLFELGKKKELIINEKNSFHTIKSPLVGYGAAANGMTLLNYYHIKPEYIIDDNPLKQGKFVPGVNVPIFHSDKLINDDRDLNILILAYNLYDEIVNKIKAMRPLRNDNFLNIREEL